MTKKIVDVRRQYQYLTSELSGTIDEVITYLQKLKADCQTEGSTLVLEWETEYDYERDRQQVNLYDRRLETDEEYQTRIELEAAQKERDLSRKRAQLEALKKELGE